MKARVTLGIAGFLGAGALVLDDPIARVAVGCVALVLGVACLLHALGVARSKGP